MAYTGILLAAGASACVSRSGPGRVFETIESCTVYPDPNTTAMELRDPQGFTLQNLRTGLITPDEYIAGRAINVSPTKRLLNEGKLKGFYHNPTENKHRKLINEIYDACGQTRLGIDMEYHLEQILKVQSDGRVMAGVSPINYIDKGNRTPHYVFTTPAMLDFVEQDGDVDSVISHELVHVEDDFDGFVIDGQKINQGTLSTNFYKHLSEVRADHASLRRIFEIYIKTGKKSCSDKFLSNESELYMFHWKRIDSSASTERERKLARDQKTAFSDLVPTYENEGVKVRFFNKDDGVVYYWQT